MGGLSDNLKGAIAMVVAMAAFAFGDTAMKLIGGSLSLFQAVFLRGILATMPLAVMVWWSGQFSARLSRRDWGLIIFRMVMEAASAWLFLSALFHMDLGTLSAILQSLPLTVTLGAAVFLGEPVGWKRLVAILVGFGGVLMIIQPGGDGFSVWSIYALGAVVSVTARDLAVRRMSPQAPTFLVALVTAAGVMVLAGFGSLTETWQPVGAREAGLLVICAAMVTTGYIAGVTAMRLGEIGFVAPFRYSSLVVSLIAGFVVFGELPNALAFGGIAIVVATGLFTLYREEMARRERGARALAGADALRNLPFALAESPEEPDRPGGADGSGADETGGRGPGG